MMPKQMSELKLLGGYYIKKSEADGAYNIHDAAGKLLFHGPTHALKECQAFATAMANRPPAPERHNEAFDPWNCEISPHQWAEKFYTYGNYGADGACGDREACEQIIEQAMRHAYAASAALAEQAAPVKEGVK